VTQTEEMIQALEEVLEGAKAGRIKVVAMCAFDEEGMREGVWGSDDNGIGIFKIIGGVTILQRNLLDIEARQSYLEGVLAGAEGGSVN